jgi:sugar phosphate permease
MEPTKARLQGIKESALAALSAELHWTKKNSAKLPSFGQFLYGIVTRQRGGFRYDERRRLARALSSPDFLVVSLLSIAYFFSIFARVSVSVLAPELQVDPNLSYNAQKHGQVIIAVQICFMVGRLVNGFLIDMANPRLMLLGYMVGSSSVTFLLSSVHTLVPDKDQRYNFILGCVATNALFQSGTWLSATKFIRDHFRPAQLGKAIVNLSVFAKLGSVASLLSLSGLISGGQLFWVDAQRFASGMTMFGTLFLLATFLFPHPAEHLAASSALEHHIKKFDLDAPAPSEEQVQPHGFRCSREITMYRLTFAKTAFIRWLGWWTKKQFVIVAIANASMAVVVSTEGFEAFLTLFYFNGLHVKSAVASQAAIVLPLGVTVSLLFGGIVLERLDKPSKADAVIFMLLITVIAAFALLGVTAGAEGLAANNPTADASGYLAGALIAIFCLGASMGYSYFVPISTFAVRFPECYVWNLLRTNTAQTQAHFRRRTRRVSQCQHQRLL